MKKNQATDIKLHFYTDKTFWKFFILAVLSGFCIFLSFPNTSTFYTAFFALVPLIYMTESELSGKRLFFFGYIMQITTMLGGFYWLIHTIQLHGHLPLAAAIPIFILYISFFGLRFPLFMLISRYLRRNTGFSPFLIYPVVFTAIEFFFPDLFPWFLANSQHNNLYFIQIADITGVYGISFVLAFINVALYIIILNRKNVKALQKNIYLYITASIIIVFYAYGFFRIQHINHLSQTANPIRVAVVQPCTPLLISQRRKYFLQMRDTLFSLSAQALTSGKKIDILLWPESSSNVMYRSPGVKMFYRQPIEEFVKKNGIHLMFSDIEAVYMGYDKNGNKLEADPYNANHLPLLQRMINPKRRMFSTAVMLNDNAEIIGNYRKVYPLPFAEYMPFSETIPALKNVFQEISDFSAGEEITLFTTRFGKIAPSICYELIIPSFTRSFILKGADFILNQTNDGWFGNTKAAREHLSLALFRAIENRVPIVRSTNSGISAFISPTGSFSSPLTELFQKTTLTGEIRPLKIRTFYTRFGDVFGWLVILVFCIGWFFTEKNRFMTQGKVLFIRVRKKQ